jgi:8-amino-7-oxononanoate synthase
MTSNSGWQPLNEQRQRWCFLLGITQTSVCSLRWWVQKTPFNEIDIQMGTLGKALGGAGAYVAGCQELIEWLINRARSFVYTTGIPPAVAATALAALEVVAQEPERRKRLWDHAAFLWHGLTDLGYTLGPTRSPILPVLIGGAEQTMALAEALLRRGIFAQGIRPPTVPEGTARLRVTPMATHTRQQLTYALEAFAAAGKETGLLV